jgi:cobalt-zinc-cadmium efflux system outer membrane protein
MGLGPDESDWRVEARLPEPPDEEPPLDGLERTAIEQSLDLRELEQRYRASGRDARAARAGALVPELRAGVAFEREEEHWEVGPVVGLEVPLFDQGQGEVGVARAEMRRVAEQHAARAAAIRAAVRTTWSQVVATARAVRHHRDVLLPLRQEIVEESLRHYNAMQLGVFQLIAAKEAEVRAGRDYVEALRAYWLSRAALDQLLAGRLVRMQETDLAPADMRPSQDREGH